MTIKDVFPHWNVLREHDELEEALRVRMGPQEIDRIDMRKMIDVPGAYHAMDCIQTTLLTELPGWNDVKPHFEAMAFIFHHQYIRDVFISECLGPGTRRLWQSFSIMAHHFMKVVVLGM